MKLSLVITLLNEEHNVAPLLRQITDALTGMEYEIIFVDDGSTDNTVKHIKDCADDHVKLVILNKNYGQTTAIAAGIDCSAGDYIVTLDGDLQNDPEDIPMMLNELITGKWDVVAGNRKNRKDGMLLRKIPSKMANALIRKLSGVHISDYGCTLKVFRREVAKNLDLYGELHRFIPILAKLKGARITQMDVKHHPRIYGESKYGLGRTFKVISDLILILFYQKYFRRPIHLFGPLGIVALIAGGVINLYLLFLKILGEDIWGRPLLILGVVLLLAGIQFITFGLIAELMMRIYYESQSKKTYNIKDIFIVESKNTRIPQAVG
ncbi:glycosyltransferase family 2 protein [Fulvivirga ulvae]|uniref:glycosyltransferase family 2 protein n=1 Tax=Fulvivirga ulvae TaxID=2904245 RepID=UPI001F26BDC4|nr:glycosyltransferase family 2 protein [Fulvivirga ulvae]UII35042.1 glycosyltransferase family 2 protein [Fulvivirga ulvae]